MKRIVTAAVLLALSLAEPVRAQADAQVRLWMAMKRELTGLNGAEYFETGVRDAALPRLAGTLVSAFINAGISRVILKMVGSEEPDVTLIVHNGTAKVKEEPKPGTRIEFSGVAREFNKRPFMLTIHVEFAGISGLEFIKPTAKRGGPPAH